MSLKIFPQNLEIFPSDRQLFTTEAQDLVPMWSGVGGVIRANGSVAQSRGTGGASQTTTAAESALQLMGAGSFEFTIENNCLPVNPTGFMGWKAYFGSPGDPDHWIYEVDIDPGIIRIRDETFAIIATITRTLGIGDRLRTELNSGFRLFINDILAHQRVSGFAAGIQYPAFFSDVSVSVPSGTGRTPVIPAPLLRGDWRLRPRNRSNNPIVIFTAPSHGSIAQTDLQAEYFNGTIPGAYILTAKIDTGIEIWVEDGLPGGATLLGGSVGSWVNSPPPVPISGNLELRIPNAAGIHSYIFIDATATFQINQGDVLTCYVYPDTTNPPQEIVLEWQATDGTGFEHRAYWGANLITNGTNGTPSRRFMGAMPPTGVWTRLEIPASLVDMEGRVAKGGSFYLFDGRCEFDQFGKYPSLQRADALISIPPLQILGDLVRTIQPSTRTRFQTNYDAADTDIVTWSVVSGSGSFTAGEFFVPAAPGTTIVRASAPGNQVADLTLNIPAVITPDFSFVGPLEQIDFDTNIPSPVWTSSAGTINSGSGVFIATNNLGQKIRIQATNGSFTAIRDVVVMAKFPIARIATPEQGERRKKVLISEAEDGTDVSRVKNKDGKALDSYSVRITLLTLAELNSILAFWDAYHPAKRFIFEDVPRQIRKIVKFDSDMAWQGFAGRFEVSFRIKEAA